MALTSTNVANAQLRNLNLRQLGPDNPSYFLGLFSGDWRPSAAKFFDQNVGASPAIMLTHVIEPRTRGPRYLRCLTDSGVGPDSFAGGFSQSSTIPPGATFQFEVFVVIGGMKGGLTKATGPFVDPTLRTATGGWTVVTQTAPEPCGGIWFQNGTNGHVEFWIRNMRYTPPLFQ